jgi:hypothetical protein
VNDDNPRPYLVAALLALCGTAAMTILATQAEGLLVKGVLLVAAGFVLCLASLAALSAYAIWSEIHGRHTRARRAEDKLRQSERQPAR